MLNAIGNIIEDSNTYDDFKNCKLIVKLQR